MDQRDRVIGEQGVRAAREREVVLHIARRLRGGEAADRVADRDPLIQRGEHALAQPVTQRRLTE